MDEKRTVNLQDYEGKDRRDSRPGFRWKRRRGELEEAPHLNWQEARRAGARRRVTMPL